MGSISFINKKSSGGDTLKPNIFMQEAEPSSKEGIWLASNKKVDKIKMVESFATEGGVWQLLNELENSVSGSSPHANIGNKIYIFDGTTDSRIHVFNIEDNTYEAVTGEAIEPSNGSAIAVDNLIYLFGVGTGHKQAYKYNPETNEYTEIAAIPSDYSYGFRDGRTVLYNNDIYLIYSNKIHKYSISDNTYTKIKTGFPTDVSCTTIVGSKIYIFYDTTLTSYDLETNEIKTLASPTNSTVTARCVVYNNDIYIFGGSNNKLAFKYSIETNEYTQLDDIPYAFKSGCCVIIGNVVYLIGGSSTASATTPYKQAKYTINTLTFTDNSVYIAEKSGTYKTQLYENKDIEGRVLYGFDDVLYNSTESGVDNTIPVYYGTGTEWVKFKN